MRIHHGFIESLTSGENRHLFSIVKIHNRYSKRKLASNRVKNSCSGTINPKLENLTFSAIS